jgi:predicted ArsR family transcriptional regulator
MNATEVARELDETQADVSYHLRGLHSAGLLEIVEEVRVRGGRPNAIGTIWTAMSADRVPDKEHLLAAALRRRTEFRMNGGPSTTTRSCGSTSRPERRRW